MKLIGVTGGVATGKSTVVKMFQRLGAKTLDSDEFAHKVIRKGKPAYKEIVRLFGNPILDTKKEIDRKKVAALIFKNSRLRKKVEKIIHPKVWKEIKKQLAAQKTRFTVIEIPLLFEAGWDKKVDLTVVVKTSRKIQMLRCRRDFSDRIRAQMPLSKKAQLADFIIDNSHSKAETFAQVKRLFQVIDKAGSAC